MDEGPVELTDPGRVALDAGEDEAGMADAEIIWDDPPAETSRGAGRNRVRGQTTPADDGDPFWEEDLTRAAAARSAETPERRYKKHEATGRAAAENTRPGKKLRPVAAVGPRRTKPENGPEIAQVEVAPSRKKPRPLTLILIFVPLLVITAAAWSYWRNLRQEYPLIAERGKTDGIPALDEGKFDKACTSSSRPRKPPSTSLGGAVEGGRGKSASQPPKPRSSST